MVGGENQARKRDRDQFVYGFSNVPHGNNVATIVSYEPTGNVNVQRVPGLFTSTIIGAGLGDLDFDGDVDVKDVEEFETVFLSSNSLFSPAADFNADGQIDYADLDLFSIQQANASADQSVLDAIEAIRALVFGAVPDSYSLNEDETFSQNEPGVLVNDLDPGSGANFEISTLGNISSNQGVTVTLAADGSFSYPSAGVFGHLTSQQTQTDFFTYSVTDGLGHTSQATVVMTIEGVNDPPTLEVSSDITLSEDATEQFIDLTLIGAGDGESQDLLLTASSDALGLIPQPQVDYTSPNTTGILKITPVKDQSGSAEVVVTIEDGGLDGDLSTSGDNASFARTIVVHVNPINDVPTLDVVGSLNIDEDSGEQILDLTNTSAGGGETQPLRITAASDNTVLVPDPIVVYTDGDSTGTLKLTPLPDQSGSAEVVVTIEDGGLDGDLSTSGDNASFARTIVVHVNPINDIPTLDPLYALGLDENAAEQSIVLSGIDSGGDEGQLVRVTATLDNPDLLSAPIVDYSEGAESGVLKFTPLIGKIGTATVTVHLEDSGLDGSFASSEDNALASYKLLVGVGVTGFTFDGEKVDVRVRNTGQHVLFRKTSNGLSLELSTGVWFGADLEGISGADSSLLSFDMSSGVPLIELTTGLTNSLSFDVLRDWRMGDVLHESTRFLRSVEMVSDSSRLIYLDSSNPWQNVVEPSDITNDGVLSVLDALVAINELGIGSFTNLATGRLHAPLDLAEWPGYYYDQNGDGRLSALDALRVLNELALIQDDEGEGEESLMISWQRMQNTTGQEHVIPSWRFDGESASWQVAAFDFVSPRFEQRTQASELGEPEYSAQQQAVDAAMVKLLHEKSWLR